MIFTKNGKYHDMTWYDRKYYKNLGFQIIVSKNNFFLNFNFKIHPFAFKIIASMLFLHFINNIFFAMHINFPLVRIRILRTAPTRNFQNIIK